MKILFLAPQPFFRVRGTPINVRNVLTALSEAGHQVDLLCFPWGEPVDIPGLRIRRVLRIPGLKEVRVGPSIAKAFLDFFMMWQAFGLCLRHRYDVIHAVEESAFFAVWLKRLFRCRLVYDMDSSISDQLSYTGFMPVRSVLAVVERFERTAMRRADFVLTVCRSLTDDVRRRAPSARVVQIEDAPVEAAFHDDVEGARKLREELQLGDGPVVVYTGNFESYQGVELLMRALATVRRHRPDVRGVMVGGEPRQVARMMKASHSLGLGGDCVFTGKRPMEQMRTFMSLASVLVSPRTKGANTALKIYSYMQSGRPIVATRLGTHTQVLDESCAVLVAPNPDDIAAGILRVLSEPLFAAALGREARSRVAERYSLEGFKEKVKAAYVAMEGDGDRKPESRNLRPET